MKLGNILAAGAGGITFVMLKIVLAVLQLFAMVAGVQTLFDIHWIFALILWLFTVGIPILPTVLGFFGAIEGWGWAWWQAGLLFFGLEIVGYLLALSLGISFFRMLWRGLKRDDIA